jgi:SAM-dependent methyltransferase
MNLSELVVQKKKQRRRAGFNLMAPFYDRLSTLFFGNQLLYAQSYLFDKLPLAHSILVFGGGTGKLIRQIELLHPAEQICYIDLSDKMIQAASSLLSREFPQRTSAYQFICGSYSDIPKGAQFDLIITPFVLDCFEEAELLIVMKALKEKMSSRGKWLFTDFHIPGTGAAKLFSQLLIRVLYLFFNLVCALDVKRLPEFGKAFSKLSFQIEAEKQFCGGLFISKIYFLQK